MTETRTEYLARITAEHPGAYHRIDDLMRAWDAASAAEEKSINDQTFVFISSGIRVEETAKLLRDDMSERFAKIAEPAPAADPVSDETES